jgi:glutamate synthase (NADPH/NADH) large chain
VLIGLGATAVYPYLAYESLAHMVNVGAITKPMRVVMANFRNSVNKGLYKIMSKMGISCVSSYRCARLFEVVGLNSEIVGLCFPGITSRVEGASFADLHDQLCAMRKRAWQRSKEVDAGGLLKFKPQGEYHAYNPEVVNTLQAAVKQRRLQPIPPLRRCGQQSPRGHHPRYAARENRRAHTDFC